MTTSPSAVKACAGCAQAKRKCGKQHPRCNRCASKGLACAYPRRPAYVIYTGHDDETMQWEDLMLPGDFDMSSATADLSFMLPSGSPAEPFPFTELVTSEDTTQPSPAIDLLPRLAPPVAAYPRLQSAWFLANETWHITPLEPFPVPATNLQQFIDTVLSWISRWATHGSTPFIHASLYTRRLPPPAADAFTTAAAYAVRSPATAPTLHCIVAERARQLVQAEKQDAAHQEDTLWLAGRTHALLVYTALGLFAAATPSQRAAAETHLDTLQLWAGQMLEAAARNARTGALLRAAEGPGPNSPPTGAEQQGRETTDEDALWEAWVLAESVRRTWMVARGLLATHQVLAQRAVVCPGDLMFTLRRGVWEAASPAAWLQVCAEGDVWFMGREGAGRLSRAQGLRDVDEFGRVVLTLGSWVGE